MPQSSQLKQIQMPDGQVVWASMRGTTGVADAGVREQIVQRLEGFQESLRSVAACVQSAVESARPDEITVAFGVELAVAKHGAIAALTGAGGSATLDITLKWTPSRTTPPAPAPAAAPAAVPPATTPDPAAAPDPADPAAPVPAAGTAGPA